MNPQCPTINITGELAKEIIESLGANERFDGKTSKSLLEKDKAKHAKEIAMHAAGCELLRMSFIQHIDHSMLSEEDWYFILDYHPDRVHYSRKEVEAIDKMKEIPELKLQLLNDIGDRSRDTQLSTDIVHQLSKRSLKLKMMNNNNTNEETYKKLTTQRAAFQKKRSNASKVVQVKWQETRDKYIKEIGVRDKNVAAGVITISDVTNKTLEVVKDTQKKLTDLSTQWSKDFGKLMKKVDRLDQKMDKFLRNYGDSKRVAITDEMITTAKDKDGKMKAFPTGYSPPAWDLDDESMSGDWKAAGIALNTLAHVAWETLKLPVDIYREGADAIISYVDTLLQAVFVWMSAIIRQLTEVGKAVIESMKVVSGDISGILRIFNLILVHSMVQTVLAWLPYAAASTSPLNVFLTLKNTFLSCIVTPIKMVVNSIVYLLSKKEAFDFNPMDIKFESYLNAEQFPQCSAGIVMVKETNNVMEATLKGKLADHLWRKIKFGIDFTHLKIPPLDYAASGINFIFTVIQGAGEGIIVAIQYFYSLGQTAATLKSWNPFGIYVIHSSDPQFMKMMKALQNNRPIVMTHGAYLLMSSKPCNLYLQGINKKLKL